LILGSIVKWKRVWAQKMAISELFAAAAAADMDIMCKYIFCQQEDGSTSFWSENVLLL